MSDTHLEEYLQAAYALGYEAYWEGEDRPRTELANKELEWWNLGWEQAHMEGTNAVFE